MFEVFKFECRYQLRSPLFLVLAGMFFLFAFLIMASESVSLGGIGGNLNFNAAWSIVYTQFFFSIIGMFGAIAIVSQAITRDYEFKTAELFFATGISPRAFLLGRFFGAALFGGCVGLAAILGTLMGTLMPWLDPERIGPFSAAPYLYALGVVTLPNLFFTSALFYTLAALSRSMLGAFIGAVAFIVLYIIIGNLVDPEQIDLLAMLGPFGQVAFADVSRYWTIVERNNELVPLAGNLLVNRVLWLSVGIAALGFCLWRYQFNLDPTPLRRKPKPAKDTTVKQLITPLVVHTRFDALTTWRQFLSQIRIDLKAIYKSIPFYAILGFAALNVWGAFASFSSFYGSPLLPVTGALLRAIGGSYTFFILLIVIYYAGEVVHRERQVGVADVLDATPFPNGVMVASKIVTLWFIIACLLAFGMLSAMLSQLIDGYTNFEIGLYLTSLFFVQGGYFFLMAVVAVFIQVLTGNKWIGMLAVLATILIFQALPSIDFQHGLYVLTVPPAPYSDMNEFGHYFQPVAAFTLYWGLFCAGLAVAAHLFFDRGRTDGFIHRARIARGRISGSLVPVAGVIGIAFIGVGSWIFYNTNILNTYRTTDEVEALQADYEKSYKRYESINLPQVVAVDSEVDLYPSERRLESRGMATLVNKTEQPMQEVLVSTHPLIDVNALSLGDAERVEHNPEYGLHRFKFASPLQPGDQIALRWDLTWRHQGFANMNESAVTQGANNRVVANGTFVNNTEIMPLLGYNRGFEIADPNTRREFELPPIVRLPKQTDQKWLAISQFGVAERTAFRTVFSTSSDQIAVAPGYQVGPVKEADGRRTYTYAMDAPIWPFFSFVSARYEVARDEHDGVDIEIYYDAKHPYNIENMIRGTKKSLDYFNVAFSPYQYRQFRILEFPRYASFAQSFPNTIPFSEAIGFVADLRDESDLDIVFYVTAHELAHQWWGHQVAGAYVQGMTVIVETLAQYSALMVMEREYGPDKMRRFLRYELDRYLSSRGGELIEELPLVLSENQQYIHYQKGSLAMYALQDAIGEDNVNLALRNFLGKYAYASAPFPTAADLVDEFRAVTPLEYQSLITDLFEKITLYDLKVTEATIAEVNEGWEVRFTVDAAKYYADGQGNESPADIDAWVDIAVFPDAEEELEDYQLPKPLYFERHRVNGETAEFVLQFAQKPHQVGIDPYNKLIDRNPEDNLKFVALDET